MIIAIVKEPPTLSPVLGPMGKGLIDPFVSEATAVYGLTWCKYVIESIYLFTDSIKSMHILVMDHILKSDTPSLILSLTSETLPVGEAVKPTVAKATCPCPSSMKAP